MAAQRFCMGCLLLATVAGVASAADRVLDPKRHHLRIDGEREWAEFPETPEAARLELSFPAKPNEVEHTLRLRQQDVKQTWRVRLNDKELGQLVQDEADIAIYLPIPAGTLADENRLTIEQEQGRRSAPDDIRVGEIELATRPARDVLSDATVEVSVADSDGNSIPARVTITNAAGVLQTVYAEPSESLAVRPGVIYTATGEATFRLAAGRYAIHASRGFEWSVDSKVIELRAGDSTSVELTLVREVPTEGWVACDTHIHTVTHSGHGDATIEERMVTLAAEGIELPIAADHNVQIDYEPIAKRIGVRKHFTPVVGNEFTTKFGHFNIFPVDPAATPPDKSLEEWPEIFAAIEKTGAKVVILNHGRDVHYGFRPFDPAHFNAVAGARLDGRPVGFNAMEVVNSGATQTDVMRLFHDWMALLNAGHQITPVGSSDSHDVTRYVVGQGRTYIRCADSDPANIDVASAVESLRAGRVMVSYGLLAEITVDAVGGPGDLVAVNSDQLNVNLRVLGPRWANADRIELYSNGTLIKQVSIERASRGLQSAGASNQPHRTVPIWTGRWTIPKPSHDVHLVAIARGPGVDAPFWQTRKPYQPKSPLWEPQLVGCSGAVWIDADGDGRKTSARDYAAAIVEQTRGDVAALIAALADSDEAIAAQAAHLYATDGGSLTSPELRTGLRDAPTPVQTGFHTYFEAWRTSQAARVEGSK